MGYKTTRPCRSEGSGGWHRTSPTDLGRLDERRRLNYSCETCYSIPIASAYGTRDQVASMISMGEAKRASMPTIGPGSTWKTMVEPTPTCGSDGSHTNLMAARGADHTLYMSCGRCGPLVAVYSEE